MSACVVKLIPTLVAEVICSFLFRSWVSVSAFSSDAMRLLVAVVPYLGHNSAYVRGARLLLARHWLGVGAWFGARLGPVVAVSGTACWGFYELMEIAKAKGTLDAGDQRCKSLGCLTW